MHHENLYLYLDEFQVVSLLMISVGIYLSKLFLHVSRGLARGMGLSSRVTSPTFTIVNEYNDKNGIPRLFHFDTYRLNSCDDFYDAGLDEYFERDGVCAIEWSSVIKEALPAERIALSISGNGNEREITVTFSPRFEDAEKKVRETMEKEGMRFEDLGM